MIARIASFTQFVERHFEFVAGCTVGVVVVGMCVVHAHNARPAPVTYQLVSETTQGETYIFDHGLNYVDCMGQRGLWLADGPSSTFTCEPQR